MNESKALLAKVVEDRATLTCEEATAAVHAMLATPPQLPTGVTTPVTDIEIAALLTAIATRGETAAELTGFAEAIRSLAQPLPLTEDERATLVDTCGTGGARLGTFNISTAAALVAASAGARVAKHGNRGVTSRCGSADVLEALGIAVDLTPALAVECLRATNFMFLYAPAMHPAMRRVQPIRKALGFRTIFNLAGPLTNPAGARTQVMGVFARSRVPIVAQTMANLGVRHAFIVHGPAPDPQGELTDGIDELTLSGPSDVAEVRSHDKSPVRLFQLTPEDAGLTRSHHREPHGGDAAHNAAILESIFGTTTAAPEPGPRRDVVLLNAAAALVAAALAPSFKEGVARAAEAIDSGATRQTLEDLRTLTRAHTRSHA